MEVTNNTVHGIQIKLAFCVLKKKKLLQLFKKICEFDYCILLRYKVHFL